MVGWTDRKVNRSLYLLVRWRDDDGRGWRGDDEGGAWRRREREIR